MTTKPRHRPRTVFGVALVDGGRVRSRGPEFRTVRRIHPRRNSEAGEGGEGLGRAGGMRPGAARIIWNLWSSDNEGRQLALLVPGWVNGCLGLHFAFCRRAWYARAPAVVRRGAGAAGRRRPGVCQHGARTGGAGRRPRVAGRLRDAAGRGATHRHRAPAGRPAHRLLHHHRTGRRSARSARLDGTQAQRAGDHRLSAARDTRAARLERAGGEHRLRHPARVGVRRPRALLDLPRARRRRRGRLFAADRGRIAHAGAHRRGR